MPEVIISGPEGRIEGRYHQSPKQNAPAALVLHPHPKHGGTMNNKVVYRMYHALAKNGFSVLRFNFRGVGRSEGEFDNGIGELTDAASVLDWLQQENPNAPTFWIGGFSFGSWIAMQLLMRRPEIGGFISIAPPANMYDFGFLAPCPSSGIIIQGDQDSIVPEESVSKLASKLAVQRNIDVQYNVIEGADHFFRQNQEELDDAINNYVSDNVGNIKTQVRIKPDRRRRQSPKTAPQLSEEA